jgi:hypothetical protein
MREPSHVLPNPALAFKRQTTARLKRHTAEKVRRQFSTAHSQPVAPRWSRVTQGQGDGAPGSSAAPQQLLRQPRQWRCLLLTCQGTIGTHQSKWESRIPGMGYIPPEIGRRQKENPTMAPWRRVVVLPKVREHSREDGPRVRMYTHVLVFAPRSTRR